MLCSTAAMPHGLPLGRPRRLQGKRACVGCFIHSCRCILSTHSSQDARHPITLNSPRLPAEKRLEQADPDRASFPLTQPFPPLRNFLTPPPPPPPPCGTPALWDPPPIAWRSCKPTPWRVLSLGGSYREIPQNPPPPPPPPPPHPFFAKPSFLLSCPAAGPAAEAARASVYN